MFCQLQQQFLSNFASEQQTSSDLNSLIEASCSQQQQQNFLSSAASAEQALALFAAASGQTG